MVSVTVRSRWWMRALSVLLAGLAYGLWTVILSGDDGLTGVGGVPLKIMLWSSLSP